LLEILIRVKIGDLAKSLKVRFPIIPAKAGIQCFRMVTNDLDSGACPGPDPGFTGVTIFYETILLLTFCEIIKIETKRFLWEFHFKPIRGT